MRKYEKRKIKWNYTKRFSRIYLEKENIQVVFPDLKADVAELVERKCYKALQKIKAILEDDSLEDEECFMKIEEIVCVFEALGSDCGCRHDFG